MNIAIPYSATSARTLIDLLRFRATIQSQHLAYRFLTDKGLEETITYAELDLKARAIASQLQTTYEVGDRAILIYPPGLELIAAYFGCLYAGIISVPVYPPMNHKLVEKLQLIIADAKPQLILSTQDVTEKIQKLKLVKWAACAPVLKHLVNHFLTKAKTLSDWDLEKLPVLTTDTLPTEFAQSWQMPAIDSEHLAFLQYTSGSTGNPKGVMVSHGNLLHNSYSISQGFGMTSNDGICSWLPPYHDMGLIGAILQSLYAGFPGTLMSPFRFLTNPYAWLKAISDYRATVSGGPNFAYDYCAKKITEEQKALLDLSCWKVAFNGAEPIHAETLDRFAKAFASCGFKQKAFYPCYGLAEDTLFVTGAQRGEGFVSLNVSTKALQEHHIKLINDHSTLDRQLLVSSGWMKDEVKLVNPDSLSLCKEHEVGEIWLANPSVTQGYWEKSELTLETFKAEITADATHTTYLRTGDLGFVHKGQLYVTGRLKDLIIIHGRNYYPQDIELTIGKAHALIRPGNCAAFSLSFNNEEHLALVCEVTPASDGEYKALFLAVGQAVAINHELAVYTIALIAPKALAKTTSGKIRRKIIKQQLEAGELQLLASWHR